MDISENSEQIFKASLDIKAKITTSIIFAGSIIGIILIFTQSPWYGGAILFGTFLIMIILTYIYSVKAYIVTNEELIIQRPYSSLNKVFLLSDILSVRLALKSEFKWSMRIAGNGGVFGYTGSFVNNKIGDFTMYATRSNKKVVIKIKQRPPLTIVITPDDVSIVERINEILTLKNT